MAGVAEPMKKLLAASLLLAAPAYAQDSRDDEIFGTPSSSPATGEAKGERGSPSSESSLADTMQIGGRLEIRETASKTEGLKFGEGPLTELKQADIYFDSRPNPNVRAFLRARFSEDSR